jgi:EamA domain-containing membrane protein RarD
MWLFTFVFLAIGLKEIKKSVSENSEYIINQKAVLLYAILCGLAITMQVPLFINLFRPPTNEKYIV